MTRSIVNCTAKEKVHTSNIHLFFSVEDEATLWELRNLAHRFAQTLEFIADISLALDCAMVQDPLYPSGKGALS